MNIRKSAGALLVPLALSTAGFGITDCYAASAKPNFINIIIDDMGFSDLGIFGSEIETPNIDALGQQGIIMTNFYAAPTSTPGRGMLFTGKSSHASGVGIMPTMKLQPAMVGKPEYEGRLSLNALPFPELLKNNGYHTMFTGKWDLSEVTKVALTVEPPAAFDAGADLATQTAYLNEYDTYLVAYDTYFTAHQPRVVAPTPPKATTEASLQTQYNTLLAEYNDLSGQYSAAIISQEVIDDMANHDPYLRGFSATRAALIPGGGNHYSTNTTIGSFPPFTPWELVYPIDNPKEDNPNWLYTDNGVGITAFPEDFYSTEYYTKMAIEMLNARDPNKPFYLCVSYTAPHNAVQASPDSINQADINKYSVGWEQIRAARFAKQKALGFWPADAVLPPIPGDRGWDNIPAGNAVLATQPSGARSNVYGEQGYSAKEMAVYANMIHYLDMKVGELITHLQTIGEYENTVIFIHSDNGAGNGIFRDISWADNTYGNLGERNSYVAVDTEWTITSNTPFTTQKASTKEGGWHTAALIHYPKWETTAGMKLDSVTSVTDFAPMILDMAGISYPTTYNGEPNSPMFGIVPLKEEIEEGHSLIVPLNGAFFPVSSGSDTVGVTETQIERYVAFEIIGIRGLRKGDWKLVQETCDADTQLFNLADDPFEQNNLAGSNPIKLAELEALYSQYKSENNIVDYTCADSAADFYLLSTAE